MAEDSVVEKIEVSDLTSGAINGSGIFDVLMQAAALRLDKEYNLDRIKGSDYSKVYLGTMESAMTQSIGFLLGKDKAYIESLLIDAQRAQTEATILKIEAETKLIDQKRSNSIIEGEILGIQKDIALLTVTKTNQEILNLKAQEYAELAKTLDVVYGKPVLGLVKAQKDKVLADKIFTEQKTKTEKAQISDNVDGVVAGTVGRKNTLYKAQSDGFIRDAEQKLTKIMTDTWSVRASTNEDTDTRYTNLDNASIGAVVNKAKAGIGA